MRYVLSGLTSVQQNDETVIKPAVVVAHQIENFACPSCECIADVITNEIAMPDGNYVLVGLLDTDAQMAVNAGYIEAFPTNPSSPVYLAGDT